MSCALAHVMSTGTCHVHWHMSLSFAFDSLHEQALQEMERIKREAMLRDREEQQRLEAERQRVLEEEAKRIANTQLPVQLDMQMGEADGQVEGLTVVKSVSALPLISMSNATQCSLQVSVPMMRLVGVPGGGANDVAQVLLHMVMLMLLLLLLLMTMMIMLLLIILLLLTAF
jgi:hypothetical protein